ncbi:MAG: hypothetical protein ACXACI_06415 [Candidatus Hodarchaeales archaeon]|jgi:hypothetical protein
MPPFPDDLETKMTNLALPFKARIELIQTSKTLEIHFNDPQSDQKLASILLEIWEGQLYTFEDFFEFLKPQLPEFIVTDLFIRPELRYRGHGLFILKSMAFIMNTETLGLFHVNTPFASFWLHNNSILATAVQDLEAWLAELPLDWQEPDAILHYLSEGEVKSYDRITHGIWFLTPQLLQSVKLDPNENIITRNGVQVVRKGTNALLVSSPD